ncbi:PAS domain-containing protein [Hephaestia sp. GCM10023244]|uniref:PAS domain-containing protein n=1 Tax=unclassified Hephaestia TaxID=2631281 RepID=UPI002076DA20|nr:PAS domain-containing protein [Hephaestia sp. MAHUQ-44]MCM8729556.1 PAS domain-containing protein [Hephaestia sp. MAHUQ-44]
MTASPDFLAGGGDMGARIRAFDWAATPLGPAEHWPAALRVAVNICLHSGQPTAVYWGPELRLIYNDAWAPIAGERHSWALGQPAHAVCADVWDVLAPQFAGVIDTGEGFATVGQMLMIERGGARRETYWDYSFSPIRDDDGTVLGVFNQGAETTAKVFVERSNIAELERFSAMLEQAPGAVALLRGPDHVFDFANRAYFDLVGRDDIIGRTVAEAIPEVIDQGFVALLDQVFTSGTPFRGHSVPVELARGSGREERLLDFVYQPVRDAGGAVAGIFVEATDSTERAWAETALRESEERLQLALDSSGTIGIWDWDVPTGRIHGDERFARLCGLDPAIAAQGVSFIEMIRRLHPDDLERVRAEISGVFETGREYVVEYRVRGEGGGWRWIHARGRCSFDAEGVPQRFAGVAIDVSERKANDAALVAAKEERDFILDLAERQRVENDAEAIMAIGAEALGRRLGADRAGFLRIVDGDQIAFGVGWSDGSVPPIEGRAPLAMLGSNLRSAALEGATLKFHDSRSSARFAGTMIPALKIVSGIGVPLLRDGRFDGGFYITQAQPRWWTPAEIALSEEVAILSWDSVARADALASLRDLNRALIGEVEDRTAERDRIWEVSQDMLGIAGADGTWLSVNPAWERELGWAPSQIVGRTSEWLEHPDDRTRTSAEVARLGEDVETVAFENRFRSKTGGYRTLSWKAVLADGRLYTTARDVTAERELGEQLRQAQKMEAVGQLTGGIAHDFNNLLTGISGAMEMLDLRLSQGRTGDLARYIGVAQTATARAAALTHRLLAFSRRQPLDPHPINVSRLIADMEDLVRRTVGPSITVEIVHPAEPWPVLADANQLENVLLNLSINARDAMPTGGKLTIRSVCAHFEGKAAADRGVEPGDYLALSVADTGTGMAPDVLERAFEPFFTTKPKGAGTGLGLSMIYGFVRQSRGQLKIESTPGEGTTIWLYLPRHDGPLVDVAPDVATRPLPAAGAGETVLLVDDDPIVRLFVGELLGELGYGAIEASDGAAAVELLRSDVRIDLLVTDIGLPGAMNGRQVADVARASRPDLPILFITGYADAVTGNDQLEAGMRLVTKPFTMDVLGQRIRAMLDRG